MEQLRRAAANAPDAFLEFCFTQPTGEPLHQAQIHQELQAFLTTHDRALIELPRDHGKSTQLCGRLVWELGKQPALRIKLVCATEQLAADRTRFLRDAISDNPRVPMVFPHLRPSQPWNAERFTIVRPAAVIGPSVAAFGVGASSTGARADLLVCDDLVDVRSIHSRAERERVSSFFHENLLNLLEPTGRFWALFTPWHADDLNARLKKNPAYATFRRAIGNDGEPIWPEKWPTEKLLARRQEIGAAAFARGYRLTPIAETELAIQPEWVQTWSEPLPTFDRTILSVDPAISTSATADASALVVLGQAGTSVYCLATIARRVAAPQLVELIDELDRLWHPDTIVFEANAAFGAVRDLFITQTRFGLKIKGIVQTRAKAARVNAFAISVENGRFRIAPDGTQRALFDEMTTFPFGEHDDLLDATATGTAFLVGTPHAPRVWL